MGFLELVRQIVHMFPDVVQWRRDRPLDRLLIADFFWSDLFSLRIIQKFFCALGKPVDVYELREINPQSAFYDAILAEGVQIA